MRWIVVLIPMLFAACAQEIILGTECPEFEGPCPRIGEAGGDRDSDIGGDESDAGRSDGGSGDGGARDASVELDAQPAVDTGSDAVSAPDAGNHDDAEIALFPAIRNPSFEPPPDASAPVKLDVLDSVGAQWRGCRGGMQLVSEAMTKNGAVVQRTDGSTFFSDSLSADFIQSGLVQQLSEPLMPGKLYALELDVWAEGGTTLGGAVDVELKLGSGLLPVEGLNCILTNFTELDTTGPITSAGWQTYCLSFRPMREAPSITLLGSVERDILGFSGAQLFIDNIRPVARCP